MTVGKCIKHSILLNHEFNLCIIVLHNTAVVIICHRHSPT